MDKWVYVDSCIPMYLVGSAHPNKTKVLEGAQRLIQSGYDFWTSAEVFQEIIHRYKAIKKISTMHHAYQALEGMVSQTESVTKPDADKAKTLAIEYPKLSSRDCIHAGIMLRLKCTRIWTFDEAFSKLPNLSIIN